MTVRATAGRAQTPPWQLSMIDLSHLKIGMKGSADLLVGPEHTAPRIGSGRVPVLATPVMINLIEAAALAAVEHLLPVGHQKSRHPPRCPPFRRHAGRNAHPRDGRTG